MAASLRVIKSSRFINYLFSPQFPGCISSFVNLSYINIDDDTAAGDLNDPKYADLKKKPHPETPIRYNPDQLSLVPVKGKCFETLPFRMVLKAGENYIYCSCGFSKMQPFCDNSHRRPHFMSTRPHHVKYRPIPFQVNETKEYWICMCKQSDNRPFCDGSHKKEIEKNRKPITNVPQ